ncbi:MAG: response regulator [Burkholderiales bacterium]|nr:response regulator [Burkholderiales bacterium]
MSSPVILLAEDNPDDEALTLRALAQCGFSERVKVVRDGAEALDFLFGTGPYDGRDVSCLPPLILLDLKLPRIDGLEVLRRIRADPRTRLACVVFFTSSGEERDINHAYGNHANSFVRKPVAFESFSRTVEQLARYWLQLNERRVNVHSSS